jgi:hypothetical protein
MFYSVAVEKLHVEFLESLQSHGTEQQVFDIVVDFIQTCSDRLDLLRDMERKVSQKVEPLLHVSLLISIVTLYFIYLHFPQPFRSEILSLITIHHASEWKGNCKQNNIIHILKQLQ